MRYALAIDRRHPTDTPLLAKALEPYYDSRLPPSMFSVECYYNNKYGWIRYGWSSGDTMPYNPILVAAYLKLLDEER